MDMKWSPAGRVLVLVAVSCFLRLGCSQEYLSDIDQGCYFDGAERALQDLITCGDGSSVCQSSCGDDQTYCESSSAMTIDFCRTFCRRRNLRYYALEAGKQCFCGGALSNPFKYGSAAGAQTNCSRPCSGDSSQTCGGEFKMQVYEFQEPVVNSTCFHPGFVKQAFISEGVAIRIGQKIKFICIPLYSLIGDAALTCQPDRTWLPNNMLPFCNYTGILATSPDPVVETTTLADVETPATLPPSTITDFLPYIIGGSAVLFFLLIVCLVAICLCQRRNRTGNGGRDISLKPEQAQVTFINKGFHGDEESKIDMPDVISPTNGIPSPNADFEHQFQPGLSTFAEDPIYQNEAEPSPPSPIYANSDAALPNGNSGYDRQDSGNVYVTSEHAPNSAGNSSTNSYRHRPKQNGKGTKDLVGWSRPSSLYQRTTLADYEDDEDNVSNEDNTVVNPNDLTKAMYAQVDKSRRRGSSETLDSETNEKSFFADPTKTSATRL